MGLFNKNLLVRTLAGIVLVVLVLGSIYLSVWSFFIVFFVFTMLTVNEFHTITNNERISVIRWLSVIASGVLFVTGFVHFSLLDGSILEESSDFTWLLNERMNRYLIDIYLLLCIIIFVVELFRKQSDPISNMAYFVLGQVYAAIPFTMLSGVLFYHGYEPIYLMALFISIWVNDTFAYLFGSLLGKHRLFERISPKKSWEGFFGGAIGVLLSGYVFSLLLTDLSLFQWFIFSEIVVIFGTLGDLLESLIKRTIGVKDSGRIIPGHGGMLDRFDSMILVVPVIYLYLRLLF